MNYKRGFTLIELMLVIGITSLLSSVLFYSTSEAKKSAEDVHMTQEAQQVSRAIDMYKEDRNMVVRSRGVAGALYLEADEEYLANMQELVDGGYISEIPRSPDGKSYAYGFTEDDNAIFVINTKKSGIRCRVIDGSGSNERSCDGILPPENPDSSTDTDTNPETNPDPEPDPYVLTIGYYERMALEPNQEYTLTYSGSGSEVIFETEEGSIQTWIAGDSLAIMNINGWDCDYSGTYCFTENGDYFEFRDFDPETLMVKVTHYKQE